MRSLFSAAIAASLLLSAHISAELAPAAVEAYRAGYDLMRIRDFRGAAADFARAVEADSTYGDAFYALGQCYLTLNKYDKAVVAFEAAGHFGLSNAELASRVPTRLADAYKKWGVISLSQRRFREAIGAFKKSLELQPNDARMHFNLGLCYRRLHKSAAAQSAFERAIEVDPSYLKPYKALADLHRRARSFSSASELYEKALAVDSTFSDARAGLALVHIDTQDYEAAVQTLKHLVELDPEFEYGYLLLGHVLNQLKRYHEAEERLRRAIELDGDNGEVHFRLAESYYGTGEYRKSVAAGLAATNKRRDYHAAQVVLADAYAGLGEWANARTWYIEAASDSRFRDYCNHRIEALESAP